jgi:hypothetical protein
MDAKPTIEQFMHDCFRERTEALKQRLEIHQVFRQRFYRSECSFDSRRGVIANSENEKIVSITLSDNGASIITTGEAIYRSRYHVISSGETWLIQEVDTECGICRGTGKSGGCSGCGGTGWHTWKDSIIKHLSARRKEPAALVTKEELRGQYFSNAELEEFMAKHFRERNISRRKELEVQSDYTRRFYSPDCDCSRWGPYGAESEAEAVLGVELVDARVRVITSGLHIMRLRYHLRPLGHSWLIWDVDLECGICRQQGRSADCFWCGGTIWERKPYKGRPTGEKGSSEEPPTDNLRG